MPNFVTWILGRPKLLYGIYGVILVTLFLWIWSADRENYADEKVNQNVLKMENADAERAENIRDNAVDVDVDGVLRDQPRFRD